MKIKLFILTLMMCLITSMSFGQIHINEFYVERDNYLIHSVVEEFDSLPSNEILIKVKNWSGVNFINMNEVLVSETSEQLVLNYITKSFSTDMSWYIRFVIQIKDNKIRLLYYDDGNVFRAGDYISSIGVTIPSVPARRYRFTKYFKKKGVSWKMYDNNLLGVKKECEITSMSLINSIINDNQLNITNDDW